MLTLVRRQPGMTTPSWYHMIHLCHRAREQIANWRSRTRELDALSRLDDRLLADIGLAREEQIVACSKLFWWSP
jgi:uncharacterized protein YjiS (DUF1127 family)